MIASVSITTRTLFSLCVVAVFGLIGCSAPNSADSNQTQVATASPEISNPVVPTSGTIQIDGSSTVFPISDAIAKEYRESEGESAVPIDVKFSGTTAGFRKFCAGETDISNASRPILKEEMAACSQKGVRYIELPVAFDALTIAVNSQNTWAQDITVAELQKVWEPAAQGKITNWKQIRASYPDRPLKLYGAGQDSGTFDYFNEVVNGDADASRTDYTASEDDSELVAGVSKDPNALGYFGFSYFEDTQDQLKALAVDYGKGQGAVAPSRAAVEKATYRPFARPLFIYINTAAVQQKPELQEFVLFYVRNAKRVSEVAQFIPLPDAGYRLSELHFYRGKVGTVFEGIPQPDVTIEELLRKQATF
ncbi:MAG: PstS family phosphate ABC transporter substrate-binding protein [Timaviella obliquedivisa GSE-PSE-MK23-08B]|nr:PstS family phosphate ABC transporter substrate-binding protein [Timaviella obliquedivisa GSE-PSE-MK23-08B]